MIVRCSWVELTLHTSIGGGTQRQRIYLCKNQPTNGKEHNQRSDPTSIYLIYIHHIADMLTSSGCGWIVHLLVLGVCERTGSKGTGRAQAPEGRRCLRLSEISSEAHTVAQSVGTRLPRQSRQQRPAMAAAAAVSTHIQVQVMAMAVVMSATWLTG